MQEAVELSMFGIEAFEIIDGTHQGEEGTEDDQEADRSREGIDPDGILEGSQLRLLDRGDRKDSGNHSPKQSEEVDDGAERRGLLSRGLGA